MKPAGELYKTLTEGISRFFNEAGKKKAILGISGGLDSAVVAALAADALGKENVHGLLLPGPYSTIHSITDALKLCSLNGLNYHIVPIDSIYQKFLRELSSVFEHTQPDVTEENIQARIRGVFLMAYANKKNALLLCTSNKSELAMGYGTLYGDLTGALMVLGDVYKTQVYELAAFLNKDTERIPEHTLRKPPSAELRLDQKDTDSLPAYHLLDPILFSLFEEGRSAEQIMESGTPPDLVREVAGKAGHYQFKYLQVPPVLAVTEHPLLPENKCYRYKK